MTSLTTTFSSANEFSPLQPIIPNLSTSEEMSVLIARIAELNRSNTVEPSIACSSDLFGQDGNGFDDDDEFSLYEKDWQKKEESVTFSVQFAGEEKIEQLQNDQKKLLEKISELEKQQKEQTKGFSQLQNDQKKILEKISELEKQQKQQHENTTKAKTDQFTKMQIDQRTRLENDSDLAVSNCLKIYWDTNSRHKNLEINGDQNLIVFYNEDNYGSNFIFAKNPPILLNNNSPDIFYFEISIKNKIGWNISIGFALKQQTKLKRRMGNGVYDYLSNGEIWGNGEVKGENDEYSYGVGDTVGFGGNWATRQIIFTKNGLRLDSSDFFVDPYLADHYLRPFVTLGHSDDKIEANFGPNFKFDLTIL